MAIRLGVRKDVKKRFRKAAMQVHGYKSLFSKSADEEFELWSGREFSGAVPRIKDPVSLVAGCLSSLRGRYTSVQLQHKAKELWVKAD